MTTIGSLDIPYDIFANWPLGHFIEHHEQSIRISGANAVRIHTSGGFIQGTYSVPFDLGFSTPIEILKEARLEYIRQEGIEIDIFALLSLWKKTFAGPTFCGARDYVFSLDQKTCTICHIDYNEGDVLCPLKKCGHIFHKTCLEKLQLQGKSHKNLTMAKAFHLPLAVSCPVCKTPGTM